MPKILIVDDDVYIRELYEEVLKNEGYDTETGVDGKEGLEKLQQGGYDLVLLDLMMPIVDGLHILDILSKNPPKVKNGPIILMTNVAHDQVLHNAINKGVKKYFIKSDITPDQILKEVKELLVN